MIGPAEIEDMMNELDEARLVEVSRGGSTYEAASSRRSSWGYAPSEFPDLNESTQENNMVED